MSIYSSWLAIQRVAVCEIDIFMYLSWKKKIIVIILNQFTENLFHLIR